MNKRPPTGEYAAVAPRSQRFVVGDRVRVLGQMTGTIIYLGDTWVRVQCDNSRLGQVSAGYRDIERIEALF